MSASSGPKCPECGCTEIDTDTARGDAVCIQCGKVLMDTMIVAEVGFQEDARGRSSAIGQFVNADGRPNRFGGPLQNHSRAANQLTIDNGRRRIRDVANTLKMSSHMVDSAVQYFKLAVNGDFHKGRRMSNVCAACLYTVCRRDKSNHMLIDFADVLSTNVYVLGHTYLKLVQKLHIGLPIIDPSLYIHRFAGHLEFGDKTQAVAMTALRLLARMRRDWMSSGRRPAGLCGAAIIVAARMHEFYRTQSDVVRVVRIGNVALRNRLRELQVTSTARLTARQIESGGGDSGQVDSLTGYIEEAEADPPAFAIALKRRERDIARGVLQMPVVQQRTGDGEVSTAPNTISASRRIETGSNGGGGGGGGDGDGEETVVTGGSLTQSKLSVEGNMLDEDDEVMKEMREALDSDKMKQLEAESREMANQDARLEDPNVEISENPTRRVVIREEVGRLEAEGELSDLDDADTAQYLNTEEEFKQKEVIWQEMNKDYLERQEYMERLKREKPEEYRKLRPGRSTKRRKKSTTGSNTGTSGIAISGGASSLSAGTASANAVGEGDELVETPRPSSKLNYDALNMAMLSHTADDDEYEEVDTFI